MLALGCRDRGRGARRCRDPAISAASILAKVARDAFMTRVAGLYPGYGFERHKGYATAGPLERSGAHRAVAGFTARASRR